MFFKMRFFCVLLFGAYLALWTFAQEGGDSVDQENWAARVPKIDESTLLLDRDSSMADVNLNGSARVLGTSVLVRVFFSFVVVLLFLYLLLHFLKRLSAVKEEGGAIEVLATQHLGPKRSLVIVKVGETCLLLGLGDSCVNHLLTIEEQEFIHTLELEKQKNPSGGSFVSLMRKKYPFLKRFSKEEADPRLAKDDSSEILSEKELLEQTKEQLKRSQRLGL